MPAVESPMQAMPAIVLALAAALAMGFAIQRGGTCMVAAVDQLVNTRSSTKLLALLECSLWTSGLGLGAIAQGLHFAASPVYATGLTTITGGLLLGLGASVNGACVFGSVARIGSRDLNYLFSLPGFFLGSLAHRLIVGASSKPVESAGTGSAWGLVITLMAVSLVYSVLRIWRGRGAAGSLYDYRHATVSIGFSFVVLAVLIGPWTYTEVFARAAHGGAFPSILEGVLLAALLAGAIIGGWRGMTVASFRSGRALQCLTGGGLMGAGSALIPGGNDNLILVGIPAFQPHAWLAIGSMVLAIAIWLKSGQIRRRIFETITPGCANQL